jgi:hypothetical protein
VCLEGVGCGRRVSLGGPAAHARRVRARGGCDGWRASTFGAGLSLGWRPVDGRSRWASSAPGAGRLFLALGRASRAVQGVDSCGHRGM